MEQLPRGPKREKQTSFWCMQSLSEEVSHIHECLLSVLLLSLYKGSVLGAGSQSIYIVVGLVSLQIGVLLLLYLSCCCLQGVSIDNKLCRNMQEVSQ